MKKFLVKIYTKLFGWKYDNFPDVDKAIVLMAPHTSMLDFFYGKMFFMLHDAKPSFLIKKESFKWPIGPILKRMGGVPVDRGNRNAIPVTILKKFRDREKFYLVITPEATREKTKNWKKGFIRIAKAADVPVVIGYLDCENKIWGVKGLLNMTGTDDEIMERLKKQYTGLKGVNPEKFMTGYE